MSQMTAAIKSLENLFYFMLSINLIDNHFVPDKDFDSLLSILIVCNEIDRIKMIKTYSPHILLIHSVEYINLNAFR